MDDDRAEEIEMLEERLRKHPEWLREAVRKLEDRFHGVYMLRAKWRSEAADLIAAEIPEEPEGDEYVYE